MANAREQRLVFGEDAELYDRARPSYPAELIDDVVEMAGAGARALDVGCGTAKAAVLLAQRGLTGVGVEPDPAMAAVAARNLHAFPTWSVTVSDFEAFEGAAFDLVSSAQAWHWLDPEVRFRKAHHLLRAGGRLALWWNRPASDDSDLRHQIDAVYGEHFPTLSPFNILAAGRPPVGALPPDVGFGQPVERQYPWVRRYSTQEWIDVMRTSSDHRLLPPARLEPLLAALGGVIDRHGGFYDHFYSCWLWSAERI